jgi:hypothetical protein
VPNATLSVRLRENFIRNNTDIDTYDGELSVRWFPTSRLSVTPRLSSFYRNADPGAVDVFTKAGVDLDWKWNRLAFEMRYDHSQREFDDAKTVEDRLFVVLKRNF